MSRCERLAVPLALVGEHLRVRLAGDDVLDRRRDVAQLGDRADAPLQALAGGDESPRHDALRGCSVTLRRNACRHAGAHRHAVRDHADLGGVHMIRPQQDFAGVLGHHDDDGGQPAHRLEHRALMRGGRGQHRVQHDDRGVSSALQQLDDLVAVASAVDAVLVLHDRDVGRVESADRAAHARAIAGDQLGCRLGTRPTMTGSGCVAGLVEDAHDGRIPSAARRRVAPARASVKVARPQRVGGYVDRKPKWVMATSHSTRGQVTPECLRDVCRRHPPWDDARAAAVRFTRPAWSGLRAVFRTLHHRYARLPRLLEKHPIALGVPL